MFILRWVRKIFELGMTGSKCILSGFLNMYAVSMSRFNSLLSFDVSLILARKSKNLQLFISTVNCKIRTFFGYFFVLLGQIYTGNDSIVLCTQIFQFRLDRQSICISFRGPNYVFRSLSPRTY